MNNKILNRCRDLSIALLEKEPHGILPTHCSFFIYKSKIIKISRNARKTTPRNMLNPKISRDGIDISKDKFQCSEFVGLQFLKNTSNVPFSQLSVINTRIDRNGDFANSCPCNSCGSLLAFLNIKSKNIYYTNNRGDFEVFR